MSSAGETKARIEGQCTGMMGVIVLNLGRSTAPAHGVTTSTYDGLNVENPPNLSE